MMQVISMSPDAGRCKAGRPSNIDRLKMSPKDRALCKPSGKYKHHEDDHGDDDDDDHAAWERFERDLRASWCRPAKARATAQANHSPWQR